MKLVTEFIFGKAKGLQPLTIPVTFHDLSEKQRFFIHLSMFTSEWAIFWR